MFDYDDDDHLGLEHHRPRLDSEDFQSPNDSQAFSDRSEVKESLKDDDLDEGNYRRGGTLNHNQPSPSKVKKVTSVGPKTDLVNDGLGSMQARQLNSPSILDSEDSKF